MRSALQKFLDNTVAVLKTDSRFVGVAVAGSWIGNTTDDYSDLDLVLVVHDQAYPQVLQEKLKIAESLGPLLSGFTGEHVGEPERLLICLYGPPTIHVDLKFINPADLEQRIENPVVAWERNGELKAAMAKAPPNHPMPSLQWIEDRFWVWVHYTATKIGRGELFETLAALSFFRDIALGPLSLVRHGNLPRRSRRLETHAKEDLPEFLKTVSGYDAGECVQALRGCIDLYRKLRNKMDDGKLIYREKAETASVDYLDIVARGI